MTETRGRLGEARFLPEECGYGASRLGLHAREHVGVLLESERRGLVPETL